MILCLLTDGQDWRVLLPRFPARGSGLAVSSMLHAILGNGSERREDSADPLTEGRRSVSLTQIPSYRRFAS